MMPLVLFVVVPPSALCKSHPCLACINSSLCFSLPTCMTLISPSFNQDEQKSSGNSLVSSPTSAAEVSASSAAPERDEQFLAGEETSPDLLALFAEVDAEAEQDY